MSAQMLAPILFKNARIFDGFSEACAEGMYLLVERGMICEISELPIKVSHDVISIDVGGRTLMPGLIDAHVHAYFCDLNWQSTDAAGEAYRTAHATRMLGFALDCGFTTVRDVGGGDYGLWRATEERLIRAPRLLYVGKILSMTGGHGDARVATEHRHSHGYCSCGGEANSISVIADGVEACVKAAREELRRGAHCIKIMGSGGVVSPTDPMWMSQYREDEIRAIVQEAELRRTYVTAHCHPVSAIRRCIEFGVRAIEHGTLMDDETARFVAERRVFVVPTMTIIDVLVNQGARLGLPPQSQEKAKSIMPLAFAGLESMRRAGVMIGFGTDLLGQSYTEQTREFAIRAEVFSPLEILRQATSSNAALLKQEGKLGCIRTGAHADILVVEGNPLQNIDLLTASGRNIRVIMRAGELIRNELA